VIKLDSVAIGIAKRTLVRDIDARIEPGEFVAVLGPNGVGKTTLLRAICGMRPVQHGTIALDGTPLRAHWAKARAGDRLRYQR
jgi:ABC-type cobalamin/Fe3+-siderophores transport system ATPase subunit